MKLSILGPPGSGKGTQAQRLVRALGVPHVSTGDILRAAIKEGTPLGMSAKEYLASGRLVPDELIIGIVRERLSQTDCEKGFLLDGFPRTIPQAEKLDALQRAGTAPAGGKSFLDFAVYFKVSEEECVRRLAGRLTCAQCSATFHPANQPPRKTGVCDRCGGTLVLREDDRAETVRKRLKVYQESTAPLIQYYEKSGRLLTVNAARDPESVFQEVLGAIRQGAAR